MITLTDKTNISIELTADNEDAVKHLLGRCYSLDEEFLVEETGEVLKLRDIFNYD